MLKVIGNILTASALLGDRDSWRARIVAEKWVHTFSLSKCNPCLPSSVSFMHPSYFYRQSMSVQSIATRNQGSIVRLYDIYRQIKADLVTVLSKNAPFYQVPLIVIISFSKEQSASRMIADLQESIFSIT